MYPQLDPSLPTGLLLIDSQRGFDDTSYWGELSSNATYKTNIASLVSSFRTARNAKESNIHILHVGHASTNPASPLHPLHPSGGHAFYPFTSPEGDEPVFYKSVNSAFIGTKLESEIRARGIRQLVVAGLTTDHCVSTSVRMAANLEIVGSGNGEGRIILVDDATATYAKGKYDALTVHGVTVESLRGEFCEVWETERIVREMGTFA